MQKLKVVIFLLFVFAYTFATTKEYRLNFDMPLSELPNHTFTKGISGNALDLSAESKFRSGLKVNALDSVDFSTSFSIGIWVKAADKQVGYKPFITNKKSLDPKDRGFVIAGQDNGSWMVAFTDGKNYQWDYYPTQSRQPINDGKWHLLAIVHNAKKDEMKMYYDGKNVATYCTNGNVNLASNYPLWIGNYTEGEWNSFNGSLDEFFFTNQVLTNENIAQIYFDKTKTKVYEDLPVFKKDLKLMGFNIFHGGHELGQEVGVNRVIEIIKDSQAEVVGVIETYGSGAIIADELGYYLYLRSSNLSIMSKYPIEDTYDLFQPFNCSAANIRISQTQTINYVNLWLHYLPNTDQAIRERQPVEQIISDEWETRASEIQSILKDMKPLLEQTEIPLFVSGDFNIDSHLDWTEAAKDLHQGYVIEWPVSKQMTDAGFIDTYRAVYPNPVTHPCLTWSPMSKLDLQYRIDFIYMKALNVKILDSEMIDYHRVRYPSDHAAMITEFEFLK